LSLNSSSEKSYQEWTQKRVKFLRSKVKYDFLTDVTENAKHCKDLCHISVRDKQALDNLKQRLHCSKDDSFYRLLDPNAQKSKNGEHVTKVIKTEMRDNMIQTLQDLMKHYSAHSNHNADIIKNLAEVEKIASDLVIFIKNDLECIQKIEDNKNSKYNEQEHKNVDQQTKIKFEEHIRTLNEIVNIHLINRVPEFHHCQANYLAAKAKTMEMKLKSLEEEGIKQTYTKEACVNLENVRRRLLSKIDMVTCEVAKANEELANYKIISGSAEYEQLVELYGKLKANIEGKRWHLNELISSDKPEDESTSRSSISSATFFD